MAMAQFASGQVTPGQIGMGFGQPVFTRLELHRIDKDTYTVVCTESGRRVGQLDKDLDDDGKVRWTHVMTDTLFATKEAAAMDLLAEISKLGR